jgi:cysteine desulfurase
MSSAPIYMDHHATTPCDPRVVERMLPFFSGVFGNPASIAHAHGRRAASALEEARSAVADFLRARPAEIVFTSGATESNNMALRGVALRRGAHLVVSAIEHKSVLAPAALLEREGVEVTRIEPDGEGFIRPDRLRAALRPETALVSIMAANGEIGTVQPLGELATVCRERGVMFHTDATQFVGKIPLDLSEIPCDLLSMSAHKVYGPKGVGALFVRSGVRLSPLIVGGGQEKNIRSGTVNLPGAVGLAEALEIRREGMAEEAHRLAGIRNHLWDRIVAAVPGASVNGPRSDRLPGNLNVSFEHIEAESLIMALRRFSISAGSACSSGEREPSHVLRAIGCDDARALSAIRIGLGKGNTMEEVDLLVDDLAAATSKLRELSVRA